MITSSVNTLSTLPGLYAIDKWGRRPLLFWGGKSLTSFNNRLLLMDPAVGMTVSQLLVAVLGTTSTGQNADGTVFAKNLGAQKASIAFVCIYIFFFASTWVLFPLLPLPLPQLLIYKLGTYRVGRNRRDLPPQSPSQGPLHDHSNKLAPKLVHPSLTPLFFQILTYLIGQSPIQPPTS
jgi:hypothetical protein